MQGVKCKAVVEILANRVFLRLGKTLPSRYMLLVPWAVER